MSLSKWFNQMTPVRWVKASAYFVLGLLALWAAQRYANQQTSREARRRSAVSGADAVSHRAAATRARKRGIAARNAAEQRIKQLREIGHENLAAKIDRLNAS